MNLEQPFQLLTGFRTVPIKYHDTAIPRSRHYPRSARTHSFARVESSMIRSFLGMLKVLVRNAQEMPACPAGLAFGPLWPKAAAEFEEPKQPRRSFTAHKIDRCIANAYRIHQSESSKLDIVTEADHMLLPKRGAWRESCRGSSYLPIFFPFPLLLSQCFFG